MDVDEGDVYRAAILRKEKAAYQDTWIEVGAVSECHDSVELQENF